MSCREEIRCKKHDLPQEHDDGQAIGCERCLNPNTMKAITLWQPWASFIAIGAKRIETRSWSTSYRGPLAIHASARSPRHTYRTHIGMEFGTWVASMLPGEKWALWERAASGMIRGDIHYAEPGCVVATCELVDCARIVGDFPDDEKRYLRSLSEPLERVAVPDNERPFGDYSLTGRFAWLLDNIVPLDEPIPARGRQGLWNWERAA